MKYAIAVGLLLATVVGAQQKQQFHGTVADGMCPAGDHSRMRMGANDAECVIACVDAHAAPYVLFDGTRSYTLSDQKGPEKFAGRKVIVSGILTAGTDTIQVDSIVAAP